MTEFVELEDSKLGIFARAALAASRPDGREVYDRALQEIHDVLSPPERDLFWKNMFCEQILLTAPIFCALYDLGFEGDDRLNYLEDLTSRWLEVDLKTFVFKAKEDPYYESRMQKLEELRPFS